MNGDIQIGLLVVAWLAAVRWAGWPERAAALLMLAAHGLDRYYHWAIGGAGRYGVVDPGHLTIDLFLLAGFLAIALRADRQWTLWAAGAQVVAMFSHPVRLIAGEVAELAYAVMIRAPSYLQTMLIFVGVIFAALRRRRRTPRSAPRWRRSPATAPERWPSG
jgi:hypothetical protein